MEKHQGEGTAGESELIEALKDEISHLRDESVGLIDMVSDAEIIKAYLLVASTEGLFCEPTSAAAIAGVIKLN